MWLQSPLINCIHGFSTRAEGISTGHFASMNLGGSDDQKENIEENRKLALDKLNLSLKNLCTLRQVHGNQVCDAQTGPQMGDALVTNKPGLILAVSIADCYPILFYDEQNKVTGAAHAGWRGTHERITERTLTEMIRLGAKKENIKVAIGQGISKIRLEVGKEVIEQFRSAGFPAECWEENKLDLIECNLFLLRQNNILAENIWIMDRCTFEDDFFSYRRDKGLTGRMWGLISM